MSDTDRSAVRLGYGFALLLLLVLGFPPAAQAQVPASCPSNLSTAAIVSQDLTISFCELCEVGTVRLVIENPYRAADDVDMSDIVVTQDMQLSGLTYLPGTTQFQASNVAPPPLVEPVVSGPNGSVITWTLSNSFTMDAPNGAGNAPTLAIEFDVRRDAGVGEEGLVSANRNIEARVEFTPSCDTGYRHTSDSGQNVLPLNEPEPVIIKTARNLDAGQGPGSYSDPVYGHAGDDVIWRIEVQNPGEADLQDLEFSDAIQPGNFEIDYVCDSEADATSASNGGGIGNCESVGGVTELLDLSVADLFGTTSPYIAAPAGGSGFYYLVGRVTDSCTNRTNSVFDVEWGCEVEAPPGGIPATSLGVTAQDDALMSTLAVADTLDVDVFLTGTNLSQPMGTKGTVTIRIRNLTGGTIRGGDEGIRLRNVLPPEYVIDPTFIPTASMAPAYGNAYGGMLDTVEWTNPADGTYPTITTSDPAVLLSNTDLEFLVTSSTANDEFPDQFNMIRHGDTLTIRFRTILIDPTYYDKEAYVDVREERPASDPPNTDPTETFPIDNQLEIWFEEFCTDTEHYLLFNDSDDAEPEDLDVDVAGSELIFILTNDDVLPLSVNLRNRGGHDADDYYAYVTFGEAMEVQSAPNSCSLETNPPPFDVWTEPVALPSSATVYRCYPGVIGPNVNRRLTFQVAKSPDANADDDLTFRADVIGQITLSDGTPLWFPTPTPRGDGVLDPANNYTIDALRARVVGYNLLKSQLGICSENNPPPGSPDDQIQIGEECDFHIESGGWFGFETPGFTYIAVQNIQVFDNLPDGQGYISSTDPLTQSTAEIVNVSLNPPPQPLDEGTFDWTHNTVVPDERIEVKDHWFRADVRTRLLNDPIDTSAAPNAHPNQSRNILTSTFDAVFYNPLTDEEEVFGLGTSTVGYPPEFRRRVDLTVTEPRLILTKEVCNETIYGIGPACTNFVPLADDGDAYDTYIWRINVLNEETSGGVTRAPAYDITVTSVTDPSDMQFVDPLEADGLDNDADAETDEAGGEGIITPDNDVLAGAPAEIISAYTESDALLRLDPGESVNLYYRVDPYDFVAPLQRLTNTVTASFDSLEGDSGNQTAPQGANGEAGGARQYVSAPAEATIQIIPVEVRPKGILRTSNTPLVNPSVPQPIVIGEEIEFELRTLIPVAQLRDFTIRDELPAGMRCTEAPEVNLDEPPYDAAGFIPGGSFTPTCTDTEVVWSFGDQTVTNSPRDDRRFDFGVQFIARLDNAEVNQDGLVIRNGGTYTATYVSYVDEVGNTIVIDFEAAQMLVTEPLLDVQKTFAVETADASDRLVVTVTATNVGGATAYNPRFLDDLTDTQYTYIGDVAGDNIPDTIDTTTYGENAPLFSYPPGYALAVGEQLSFTFVVEVDTDVQPLEILYNTVQSDWTSLPTTDTALNTGGSIGVDGEVDGMRIGALPNAGDPVNDYEAEATESVYVPALAIMKDDLDVGVPPEVGSHRNFEVRIDLPEGVSTAVRMDDNLATGNAGFVFTDNAEFPVSYEFVGIESINGVAPEPGALNAVPVDGSSGVINWDIGDVTTLAEDDSSTQDITPYIRINYTGRINNDLDTDLGDTLQNRATAYFINGDTGLEEGVTDDIDAIAVIEPAVTATKVISNVTEGKNPDDPIALGDLVQYTLTMVNLGNATAYDLTIVDTLPVELTLDAAYTPTAQINGIDVDEFAPIPLGAPKGPLVWGGRADDDSLDLAPGETLELTYRVILETPADETIAVTNIVWVDWTSRNDDDVYERTGEGCPTITLPNDYCYGPASAERNPEPVGPPAAIGKVATQATATIGEIFTYRLTVPGTPHPLPLYDVRILDDLGASAADLEYVGITKVAGSLEWVPENTGSITNLVIEDTAEGIDIPIGEQVVLDIAVRLTDTPTNVRGLNFTNTASYTYNRLNNAPATVLPGIPYTGAEMTIVEPDELTLEKYGPTQLQQTLPGRYVLNVHNLGDSPAYGVTVYDKLPNGDSGGTCDVAPTIATIQVVEADGTTTVSGALVADTDYSYTFAGDPDCTLAVSILSAVGAIGPDQRLLVEYDVLPDNDSQQAAVLTNVAGATEWFGLDVSNETLEPYARTYTRAITDGTVGTLDHEDAHDAIVFVPQLTFEKTVVNLTSGADPATVAAPGDVLRYSLRVANLSDTPLNGFSIVDEIDRLNDAPRFVPGSLTLVTVPDGADTSATSPAGGASGTGLLDVRALNLGPASEETGELLIEFEVQLESVIPNGSYATNQSTILFNGITLGISDDPYVNGAAEANVVGDEDPTVVTIESGPDFRIEKISSYLTGDPNILLAGETLRYTITVQNVGSENATGVEIVDQVPANTTYVPGSTTLNGEPVPDAAGDSAPMIDGIPVNAPQDPRPGYMNAGVADNVATITFDVIVYPDLPNGTILSNQAFVSAVDYGLADLPSDDPRTEVPDDPTRDVVGNYPLIFAPKSAELVNDLSSPGIVDPGDTLRYTIIVYNNGNVPATASELTDQLPQYTSYVADTVTLNGEPVGQPDNGMFPIAAGIPVASADVTPPVPAEGEGVINPGQSAVVRFDVTVNADAVPGTLITNQAIVYSQETGDLFTDGDGNPATGPEPTVVVVGDVQQLSIIKEVSVVDGGPALAGATLEYAVTVRNIGEVPAFYVEIQDDYAVPNPGYLQYIEGSATMNGFVDGVTVNGTLITADYFTEYGPLEPEDEVVLRFRAIINPELAVGTTVTNTGRVYWDDPQRQAEASVSIDVGAMPNAGMLSGEIWHDADHDNTPDEVERPLEGWRVELFQGDRLVRTQTTDADGNYLISAVPPNYGLGEPYSLRFSAPDATSRTALLGVTDSDFTDGMQVIEEIEVTAGSNLLALNMPVDPNGVVYDSVTRQPIAGVRVTMSDPRSGAPLPASCFDDPNQQNQVTVGNGYYKFDLNFSDPGCPSGSNYVLSVTEPDSSYLAGISELIPPTTDTTTLPFDVPACAGSANDAVPATTDYCEVQSSEFSPPQSTRARTDGTVYHTFFTFSDVSAPGSAQLFNNHLPLDPRLGGAVAVTKSTPLVNVSRGQAIPYVITVSNSFGVDLEDVNIVDRFPAGFKYVKGSARIDNVAAEPEVNGRELVWRNLSVPVDGTQEIKLLLTVGAGVTEGEFVNRALAVNDITGGIMSEEATATVRVVPDPTFDCTDVTGKVYDDLNLNGRQDEGEAGIPSVRLVTARGLAATTDSAGRYHITCAIVPNESRGSNFVIKIDDRSLPSGFRASTRPVQIQRATRGKALRINFGASIHRVVGLDIADPVFVPGEVVMRDVWRPRIDVLLRELRKAPSILRLSYVADVEDERLVNKRLELLKEEITAAWRELDPDYELVIEPEVFWRLGGPPDKPEPGKR